MTVVEREDVVGRTNVAQRVTALKMMTVDM